MNCPVNATIPDNQRRKKDPFSPDLNNAIDHLAQLLKHLPDTLPLARDGTSVDFSLDPDDVKDEGLGYALNRRLEILFKTHSGKLIQFDKRAQHSR